MKFFLDPIYTLVDIRKCQTHFCLQEIAKWLVTSSPDNVVYYGIPDDLSVWRVIDLYEHPRVIYVPFKHKRDRYKEFYFPEKDFYSTIAYWGPWYDWDVLISTRSLAMDRVRFIGSKVLWKQQVIFEVMPIVKTQKTVTFMDRGFDVLQMITFSSYINSDDILITSQHETDGAFSEAARYLSSVILSELKEKVKVKFVIPGKLDLEFPLKSFKHKRKNKFRILYTQRIDTSQRRPENIWEILHYCNHLFKDLQVDFQVTTNSPVVNTIAESLPFVKFDSPVRDKFYEFLRDSHVFMSYSKEEGMAHSLLEAVCFGCIGVIKKELWSLDMFGPDYPFFINSPQEGASTIKYIYDNYEECYKKYLAWYEAYFVPMLKEKGNLYEYLGGRISAHEARLSKIVKNKKITDNTLSTRIDLFAKSEGIKRFILQEIVLELSKKGGTTNNFEKAMKVDQDGIPMKRAVALYETYKELEFIYGWRQGTMPGELYREG